MRVLARLVGCCLVAAPLAVRAQPYASTTVTQRPEPATQALGATDRVAVDPDVAKLDADALLEPVPGAQVRTTGGPDAPSYLSLRGSAPWQTLVLLDGVPVSGADALAVDLSAFPLVLLDAVDVYRGQVPVQLGAAQPGGAVNLRFGFAATDRIALRGGVGAFGYRTASAAAQRRGAVDWLAGIAYSGAESRFWYFDDAGTRFDTGDDTRQRRRNADHDAVAGLIRVRARPGGWRLTGLGIGGWRAQGVPGLVTLPTVALGTTSAWLQPSLVASRTLGDAVRIELVASGRTRYLDVADPGQELAPGTLPGTTWGHQGMLSLRPTVAIGPHVVVEPLIEGAVETLNPRAAAVRARVGGAAGVEGIASFGEASVRAGVRADLAVDRVGAVEAPGEVVTNPSLGVAWERALHDGLALGVRASGGAAARLPGFVERFGAGVALVGDPELRPEQRWGAEAGFWLTGRGRSVTGTLDVAGYARAVRDLIVWVESGAGVSVAQNLDRARIAGLEATGTLELGRWVAVASSYTWIDAVDTGPDASSRGRRVPWVVPHQLSASVSGGADWLRARVGVEHSGMFTIDRPGLRPMPARTTVSLGVRLAEPWLRRVVLDVQVTNLLDARVQSVYLPDGGAPRAVPQAIADYAGYPLPGRALYATLSYTHPLSSAP